MAETFDEEGFASKLIVPGVAASLAAMAFVLPIYSFGCMDGISSSSCTVAGIYRSDAPKRRR